MSDLLKPLLSPLGMLNYISYDMSLSFYFKLFLSVCRFLEYFLTTSKASEVSRLENSYDPPIINTEPHSDQLENTYRRCPRHHANIF